MAATGNSLIKSLYIALKRRHARYKTSRQ